MGGTSAIDALLAAARADLNRVQLEDLDTEIAAGALVVDTRPVEQRQRDGEVSGALYRANRSRWRRRERLLRRPDRRPCRVEIALAT